MASFTFRGFAEGTSVALSCAQGALNASASVATWGEGNLGSVEILARAPAVLAAPSGIWLEAVSIAGFGVAGGPGPGEVYDPSFHEITFVWTVRGQPLAPYTAPQNLVAGWNNPNVAYGKKVAFHFPDPGSYTIDLWAVDRHGTTAAAETTVTVAAADAAYPGASTVCFSNDPGETWAGEKPGCQRATSFAQIQAAISGATGPLRILFKRGRTVTRSEISYVRARYAGEWMNHLGAWGTGAKPVLEGQKTGNMFGMATDAHSTTHLTIENLAFRGSWDAEFETGVPCSTPFNFWSNTRELHVTISRCDFSGFSNVWLTAGPTTGGPVIVADCTVTDWQDYGFYDHGAATGKRAFIGTRITQNVNAGNGNPNVAYINFYNEHGPVRHDGEVGDAYFACCDMFSRNGWSSTPPDTADQPCIRFNQGALAGATANCDRCVFEGGHMVLKFTPVNSGQNERPGNYLIDKCLLIGTAKTWRGLVAAGYGGLTIRNTIGVLPNVPEYHAGFGLEELARMYSEGGGPAAGNLSAPMQIYGNTALNLRNAANDPGLAWRMLTDTAGFVDVTEENNLVFAPGLDTPVNPQAPLDMAAPIPGVSPRYRGVLFKEFPLVTGTIGTVAAGASFTVPYPAGTNQAYWQALPAGDNRHAINLGNVKDQLDSVFYAELGEMTVAFEASAIRITNVSGTSWSGDYWLALDRHSQKSAIPATHASPATLPMPRPVAAIGPGLGLVPYDDFEGTPRGAAPSAGALAP